MHKTVIYTELTPGHILLFFVLALTAYVFPLVNADYIYYDDIWRTYAAWSNWDGEGRVLVRVLYNVMGFNGRTPNVFPLPLIISTFLMSLALRRLVFLYFERPTLSSCLVVLPIWYSPFFLQNLSYQYDGAAMVLSLVTIIYSVSHREYDIGKVIIVPGVLIACALALYQLSINFFIVLCCIELVKNVSDKKSAAWIFSLLGYRAVSLVLAGVLYYFSAYLLMNDERQGLLALNESSITEVVHRLVQVLASFGNLLPYVMRAIVIGLLILSCAGYFLVGRNILFQDEKWLWKTPLVIVYALVIPVACFFISGVALLFQDFNMTFRTFVGGSGVLVLIFYLSHKVLVGFRQWCGFVLVLPLIYSLSVSYAYGRVLIFQKELEASVLSGLAYDIQHSALDSLEQLYMIPEFSVGSLAAAEGLYAAMPILRSISSVGYVILPEMLPRVGINNVYLSAREDINLLVKEGHYQPIIVTRFYSFYVVGRAGYILMNKVAEPRGDEADICLKMSASSCR